MPRFVTIAALVAPALLLASFGGPLHPLGDSLAVFRLGLVLAALVLLPALAAWPRLAVVVLVGALLALSDIGAARLDRDTPGPVSIYQKNMWYQNDDIKALEADIRRAAADIVLLQEVSIRNMALVRALRDIYPNQKVCSYSSRSSVAVLTRLPVTDQAFCGFEIGLTGLQVQFDTGPAWVASLHLTWPFPLPQMTQVRRITSVFEDLEGPVILGGDFNTVPWSTALHRIRRATGTTHAGGAETSFHLGPLPLPIDHVLAPGGGTSEARGLHGSDHRGLLARVHLVPVP